MLLLLLDQSLCLRPFALATKSFHFDFFAPSTKSSSHNLTFNRLFFCEIKKTNRKKCEWKKENVLKCDTTQKVTKRDVITNYRHTFEEEEKNGSKGKCGYHRLFKRHKLLTHLLFIFIDLKTATPTIIKNYYVRYHFNSNEIRIMNDEREPSVYQTKPNHSMPFGEGELRWRRRR